ncbi:MAG: hypothetical protein RL885_27330 [Planctomycetota bacterium]
MLETGASVDLEVDRDEAPDGTPLRFSVWSIPVEQRSRLEPLGTEARLIASFQHDRSLLPAPHLTESVRVATGEVARETLEEIRGGDWTRAELIGTWEDIVPAGSTLELAIEPPGRRSEPAGASPSIGIAVSMPPVHGDDQPLLVGVSCERYQSLPSFEARQSAIDERAPSDTVGQREVVVLQGGLQPGGTPAVALFPKSLVFGTPTALLFAVEPLLPPSTDDELASFASQLAFARQRLSTETDLPLPPFDENTLAGWRSTREALSWPDRWRETLVYIAANTGASLARDLCLLAPDALLEPLAEGLRKLPAEQLGGSMGRLGWHLEQLAMQALIEVAETDAWEPQYDAILVRRLGAAGRDISAIGELMANAKGLETFQRDVIDENWLRLESSSPADRMRAYDWLKRLGQAPADYDPLSDRAARRAALRAAMTAVNAEADEGK